MAPSDLILIKGVPHFEQEPDFCGEAVTAMYLRSLGKAYSQGDVFNVSGMDPARGMGATTRELKVALTRIGFKVGEAWYFVPRAEAQRGLDQQFSELRADLSRGIPSIVCTHYDDAPDTTEHFRLVLGYDPKTDEVIYHEPAEANGAYRRMKRALFLKLWPLKYEEDRWTVIRFRLEPGELREPAQTSGRHTPADFAQHVMKLKPKLGFSKGLSVVIEPPFVVIGDEPIQKVRSRAAGTVRWATQKLKQDYFKLDPEEILDIWLFKGNASYRKGARQISGEYPDTPYGYYSDRNKALVMNIATGGGTLVHEIVHPFMEANFPQCPAWFNEGMGSLYEQSSARAGHIIGLTNWRLEGLQEAIRDKEVPSFKTLTSTTSDQFYSQDPGTNYAQSRYLMYYLQEHGLLIKYYREFTSHVATDPTGYKTLKKLLKEAQGVDDMVKFQQDWEKYVISLRFP